jgi:ABC-type polysaccharide/polyol phosphate export permease
LAWTFFASALNSATQSLVGNASLIDKIYFPREIIPLSAILSRIIDLLIATSVLIALMLFYKIKPHITILAVPLVLLLQIVLVAGMGFILSMGNLFYRDVGYIVTNIVPLLMFITPVIYPIKVASTQLQGFLTTINPMIAIIDTYRDLILLGRWPDLAKLAIPVALCFCFFFMGLLWFHKSEHLFAENI